MPSCPDVPCSPGVLLSWCPGVLVVLVLVGGGCWCTCPPDVAAACMQVRGSGERNPEGELINCKVCRAQFLLLWSSKLPGTMQCVCGGVTLTHFYASVLLINCQLAEWFGRMLPGDAAWRHFSQAKLDARARMMQKMQPVAPQGRCSCLYIRVRACVCAGTNACCWAYEQCARWPWKPHIGLDSHALALTPFHRCCRARDQQRCQSQQHQHEHGR